MSLPVLAAVFFTMGLTTPSSWADKPATEVTIKNKRNNPVLVRDSVVRHPVYCSRYAGNDGHMAPYDMQCYNSVSRERVETIPKGYSLVITDVMITDSRTSIDNDTRYRVAFGRMASTEAAIIYPAILIQSRVDSAVHRNFHTSPLIFHHGERFAVSNNGDFTVRASAGGYVVKTSDLKYLF